MKHKTDYPDKDYRTEKQWKKSGYVPNDNAGTCLWTNPHHGKISVYYLPEEVHPMSPEEKEKYRAEQYERRLKYKVHSEERRAAEYKEDIQRKLESAKNEMERIWTKRCRKLAEECLELATMKPVVSCENKSELICIDCETTGLSPDHDEILQVSIIDGEGNILLSTYVHPYWTDEWDAAQEINGITPQLVDNAPYPHELIPMVRGILNSAKEIVSYNGNFDIEFLEKWGLDFSGMLHHDVMMKFAPIYGEWSERFGDYRWQKLEICASYYNYQFNAHDSLEDAKATLYCFKKIQEQVKCEELEKAPEKNVYEQEPSKPRRRPTDCAEMCR